MAPLQTGDFGSSKAGSPRFFVTLTHLSHGFLIEQKLSVFEWRTRLSNVALGPKSAQRQPLAAFPVTGAKRQAF